MRTRVRSLREAGPSLALIATFITFMLTEISLIRYYQATGDIFVVNLVKMTLRVDLWFYTFAFVLLSFTAIILLALYFMELKTLYLVPLIVVLFSIYITYFTYRLMGISFYAYLSFNEILAFTMALVIGLFLVFGSVAMGLFHYIYYKTKSLRALSLGIGTFIIGMLVLGADYLMATLPIAIVRSPLPQREVLLNMLKEWPLNVLYILASLLLFLGQTRVLDALFGPSRGKEERAWIETIMEGA
mgnify:CR=1 FL=1